MSKQKESGLPTGFNYHKSVMITGMIRIEHRKEERVSAKKLPNTYHDFIVSFPDGKKEPVKCIEISANGLSFLSTFPPETYIPGTQIELFIEGNSLPLHGIILSSEMTKQGTREGVRFEHDEQYASYLTNFNIIISRLMS